MRRWLDRMARTAYADRMIDPARPRGRPRKPRPEPVTDAPRGVADRLRESLAEREWSVRHLALAAGLSEQAIRGVLGGADPRCSTVDRLARALGKPAGWLAFGG